MKKKFKPLEPKPAQDPAYNPADKVLDRFADMMIKKIESLSGDEPWKKPWLTEGTLPYPKNLLGRSYNGMNALMLLMFCEERNFKMSRFGTFDTYQRMNIGIPADDPRRVLINKGEQSFPILLSLMDAKHKDTGEKIDYSDYKNLSHEEQKEYTVRHNLRAFRVFNVEQTNLKTARPELWAKLEAELPKPNPDKSKNYSFAPMDELIRQNKWVCPIEPKHQDNAYYSPKNDVIVLPEKSQFDNGEAFYSTAFHEMVHSTGAESRLNRYKTSQFGNSDYAREELVAELGAALTAQQYGMTKNLKEDSCVYLKSWLSSLKKEPDFIKTTLSDVKKATSMLSEHIDKMAEQLGKEKEKSEDLTEGKEFPQTVIEERQAAAKKRFDPIFEGINDLKAQHGNELVVLIKAKSGYVVYGHDAYEAAKLLGLQHKRTCVGIDKHAARVWIPENKLEDSLAKLVQNGKKVAVADSEDSLTKAKMMTDTPRTYYFITRSFSNDSTIDTDLICIDQLDGLRDNGNPKALLKEVADMDARYGLWAEQSEIFLNPVHKEGAEIVAEDEHYALIYNSLQEPTYEIMRKTDEQEVREHIEKDWGLHSDATPEVEAVACKMAKEKFSEIENKPLFEINGKQIGVFYVEKADELDIGTFIEGNLICDDLIEYDHSKSPYENLQAVCEAYGIKNFHEVADSVESIARMKAMDEPSKDYYFEVAMIEPLTRSEWESEAKRFGELIEKQDYKTLLKEAAEYDMGDSLSLDITRLPNSNPFKGTDIVAEDANYAVFHEPKADFYFIERKVSEAEIRDCINHYGLDSDATDDVKAVAYKMTKEEFRKIDNPSYVTINGEEVGVQYNETTNKIELGNICNAGLIVTTSIEYDHNKGLDENLQDAYEAYEEEHPAENIDLRENESSVAESEDGNEIETPPDLDPDRRHNDEETQVRHSARR